MSAALKALKTLVADIESIGTNTHLIAYQEAKRVIEEMERAQAVSAARVGQPPRVGYIVEIDGRVFSVATNWRGYGRREMQQTPNGGGYPSVRILVDGKRKRIAVHVLVARHHLSPRPSKRHEVRHLDGNRLNPHVSNLAWGTQKDNALDRDRHGRTSRGITHSLAIKRGLHGNV